MAEGSSPDDDDDEKLFLGSLRASRAIKNQKSEGIASLWSENCVSWIFRLFFENARK